MSSPHDFLAGGGEMGERIRAFDWASTPLGPIAQWPQSLRSAVSILLPSKAQISLFWGPDLVTLYNDAYRPVFGAKHPSALGRPIREAWDELWRAGLKELFDGVLQTGEAFWAQDLPFFMERHGYLEETYFDVSYDPVRDESGGVGGVFCIVSEKTGRVLGERRLRTLRDLARISGQAQTLEHATREVNAVLCANPQDLPFALMYAPDAADDLHLAGSCGLDASRAPPGDAPWLRAAALSVLPASVMGDALVCAPWPEPLREVVAVPLSVAGEAGHGWLVSGISPRRAFDDDYRDFIAMVASSIIGALDSARRSEDERKRAEMLAEVDRAKTAFFSNVSHEFRTPLTLLMGPVSDALADNANPLDAVHRERLEMAQRSALRLQKLVNSLLDFSRIEAGRAQARYVPTDLGTFTAELASSFRSAMDKAGLRFKVDTPPSAERAWVDRDFWEKIVLNLLSNAFKFTFEGEIAVALRRVADGFELTVRDTGVGIPEHDLPRVFERFHRVEGARSRTHEGSGIGLALVHDLVRLHGGRVSVESIEGRGSTFTVTLPAGSAHLDAAQLGNADGVTPSAASAASYVEEALRWLPGEADRSTRPAASRPAQTPRIVLADDNADMRDYIRHLLASDYDVEAVSDGIAALEAVQARGADLVLSDVMMPRLDGPGLVQRLRRQPETAKIPVILLSARAGEAARIEGMGSGADDYLEKPFAARELLARVSARIEIARQRRLAEMQVEEEARRFEKLNEVGLTLAAESDLERIVQAVTDVAVELCAAEFGAFFYNVTKADGESYMLYTLSGVPRERFSQFPMPRNTRVFGPTFSGEGIVRVDDIKLDPRYGHMAPHYGMPKGHLPVSSYLAVPVITRGGEVIGGLFFGHSQPARFTEAMERIVAGIAAQAAVAIDNARLHEQRLRLIAELQEADRRKDEFIATLSHELRNPLAPLRNGLRVMQMQAPSSGDSLVPMMTRQVDQLVRLVDDLLEVSRISRDTFELRRARLDLRGVVRNAVETIEPLMRERGHTLDVSLPERSLSLDGDAARLTQVLSNLLSNAARYTDPGGRISLRGSVEAGRALIAVQDTGVGFDAEHAARIFEMFARGERSQGLGIGLALARRLVEMHGGTLEGMSEGPGRGATFTMSVPLGEATALVPAHTESETALPPIRVLVVDDNRDAGDTLQMLLELLGARARVADGGETALALFDDERPDAVLLDIGMPGMDGYQVARAMRERDPQWRGALVALTGWGQDNDRRKGKEAGFAHHLVKPVDLNALRKILATVAQGD